MANDRKRAALVAIRMPAPGKVGSTVEVEIATLATPFFVRQKLDADWVLHLAELLENGAQLAPIEVVWTPEGYVLRDGRHRVEAHKLTDRSHIKAVVVAPAKDLVHEISAAYNANAGGSLPPNREDMAHTISLLLSQGLKPAAIAQLIPTFPPSLVRKYVNGIFNREKFARLREAVSAVSDGEMNAPQAAEKYRVDIEQLRKQLGSKKKGSVARAAEMVSGVRRKATSFSQSNGAIMRKQLEGFEDGDVTAHQLDLVVEAMIKSAKNIWVSAQGWKPRVEEAKSRRARLAGVANGESE